MRAWINARPGRSVSASWVATYSMRRLTLATGTFETHRKPTRREKFLADMEKVVPWQDLCAVIAPYYPKGENGRPPVGLERMLRINFLQ